MLTTTGRPKRENLSISTAQIEENRRIKERTANFPLFVGAVFFCLTLYWAAVTVLQPDHTFFALRLPSAASLRGPTVLWLVLTAAGLLAVPRWISGMRHFWAILIIHVVALPATVMGGLLGQSSVLYYGAILLASWLLALSTRIPARHSPSPARNGRRGVDPIVLLYLGCAAFAIFMLTFSPSELRLVGFNDVYALRREARLNANAGYAYAVGAFSGAIGPLAFALGIRRRQFILVAASAAGSLLIYMSAGNKSALLSIVLSAAIMAVFRKPRRGAGLPWVLSGAIAAASIVDTLSGRSILGNLLIDRVLIAPGVLASDYFQHYSQEPKLYWTHSFLSFLSHEKIEPPGYVIGRTYYAEGVNANANFIGDGYANAGVAGVLLMCLVLIIFMVVCDRLLAARLEVRYALASSCPLLISVTNMSPLTALLTGGGLLFFLLVFLLQPLHIRREE